MYPLSRGPGGDAPWSSPNISSALLLLMLGVFTNDHDPALAPDDLAFFTNRLNRWPDFHVDFLLVSSKKIYLRWG